MIVTKKLSFSDSEWYELTVLLKRGIQSMQIMHDPDDSIVHSIVQKWIARYQKMIREIDK